MRYKETKDRRLTTTTNTTRLEEISQQLWALHRKKVAKGCGCISKAPKGKKSKQRLAQVEREQTLINCMAKKATVDSKSQHSTESNRVHCTIVLLQWAGLDRTCTAEIGKKCVRS